MHSGHTILLAFDDALASIDRDRPFDVRVGSLILLALLEQGPDYVFGTLLRPVRRADRRDPDCAHRTRPARPQADTERRIAGGDPRSAIPNQTDQEIGALTMELQAVADKIEEMPR